MFDDFLIYIRLKDCSGFLFLYCYIYVICQLSLYCFMLNFFDYISFTLEFSVMLLGVF